MSAFYNPIIRQGAEKSLYQADSHIPPWRRLQAPDDGTIDNKDYAEPPLRIHGGADRYSHRDGNDDYAQAGNLYCPMDEEAKKRLAGNIVGAMLGVPRDIQVRQIAHFMKADPAYGGRAAGGLGIDPAEVR